MPTVAPLAERGRGRSVTSHRAARHHSSPSPCRVRSAIESRSFPTTSSRWARRLRLRDVVMIIKRLAGFRLGVMGAVTARGGDSSRADGPLTTPGGKVEAVVERDGDIALGGAGWAGI